MARLVRERRDAVRRLGEIFRRHGYEGTSLALITAGTGLGKGSLYNFFPGGKDEMAAAVLDDIDGWFADAIFRPLRRDPDPVAAIGAMLDGVAAYFDGGGRICLVGVFALGEVRDRFAARVQGYFAEWTSALSDALARCGHPPDVAADLAEDAVLAIQGALVLARAVDDRMVFGRALDRLRIRLAPVNADCA